MLHVAEESQHSELREANLGARSLAAYLYAPMGPLYRHRDPSRWQTASRASWPRRFVSLGWYSRVERLTGAPSFAECPSLLVPCEYRVIEATTSAAQPHTSSGLIDILCNHHGNDGEEDRVQDPDQVRERPPRHTLRYINVHCMHRVSHSAHAM